MTLHETFGESMWPGASVVAEGPEWTRGNVFWGVWELRHGGHHLGLLNKAF